MTGQPLQLGQWVVWDSHSGLEVLTRIVLEEGCAGIRWAVEDPGGAWRVADVVNAPEVSCAAGLPPSTRGCWVHEHRIRPATQEEVARAQLTSLDGL